MIVNIPITEVHTGEVFRIPGEYLPQTYRMGEEVHRDGASARYRVTTLPRGNTFNIVAHDTRRVEVSR